MSVTANLEALLAEGEDNATLRYGLGAAYLKAGDPARAARHLAEATAQAPDYSAAWKLYGRALAESGRTDEAVAAYDQGIQVADRKGDIQAVKEMRVFRKRLRKVLDGTSP